MRLPLLLPLALAAGCATPLSPHLASFAPSAIPDRIVLTWSDDPATTQTVNWRTDPSAADPVAEIALATDGPAFAKKARRRAAKTEEITTELGISRYHTATFRELEPRTKYAYRVGDGQWWSEWSHFTTASAEPAPFSFLYFGDAQNNIKSHWSRVVREAFKDGPRASFLVHAGDLVNNANSDSQWGEWCYAAGWILRTVPSIATPGNHEHPGGVLSRNWKPMFEFPRNGPDGLEDTVYYVDYQGARIVSLNTSGNLDVQAAWFDEVMRSCTARWKIVTMHFPIYSTAKSRDQPKLRAKMQPLFDKYAVDIVLQGHDHAYGRTERMRSYDGHGDNAENVPTGVRAQRGETGTVYVVSVSGPKMYTLAKKPFMVSAAQNKQLYQVISVDHDALRYAAHTATGELFDRFTLEKSAGGPNRLIEP